SNPFLEPALAGIAAEIRRPLEERKGPEMLQMSNASDGGRKGPRLPDSPPESGPMREDTEWVSPVEELKDGRVRLIPDAVLDRAGRYQVIRYLGSGGFGDVYLIRDTKFAREVVTKIPNKERFDEGTLARFRQEGIIGGSLDPQFAAWVLDVVELREEITASLRRDTDAVSST